MPARTNNTLIYVWIALLGIWSLASQARYAAAVVRGLIWPDRVAGTGLTIRSPFPTVTGADEEAEASGIRRGDVLLEVEGRPVPGLSTLAREAAQRKPGDAVRIRLRRPDGAVEEVALRLKRQPGSAGVTAWILSLLIFAVVPLFCTAVGFWVVVVRPRLRLAWVVLVLLLSIGQFSGSGGVMRQGWEDWVRVPALAYHGMMIFLWPLSMLLFGIRFPERWSVDERFPWLKWPLVVPLGALAILTAVAEVGSSERYRLVEWLLPWLNRVGSGSTVLAVAAIGVFFLALFSKSWTLTNPDSRRRMRLLMTGSLVSLTPMCALLAAGLLSRRDTSSFPDYIVLPVIVLFLLFPVTVGYVIVVQRAFGVGMVIRTGVQYALARGGVRVLIALLVVGMFLAIKAELGRPDISRARILQMVSFAFMGVALLTRFSRRVAVWIDRRFFREAVSAEQLLSELSEQVRTMVEAPRLTVTVACSLAESLHVERIALLLRSNGSYRPVHMLGYAGEPEPEFAADSATVKRLEGERRALTVYLEDRDSWVWTAPMDHAERQRLERLGTQLLLPVAVKERLLGFVSLGPKRSEEPYSRGEMRLLEAVALQTGLALEHSRLTEAITREVARRERLNREIEIAREVQERLFPQKAPVIEGLECAGACRPAQGVGGDYYDFLELPDGQYGFAIGDVSGKGIPAALLMASLQASLRAQTISRAPDLAAMMGNTNRLIHDSTEPNRYATFFYAQYEPSSRRLRYVNAGHNAPMLFRSNGEVLRLEEGGPVIGLFRPAQYSQGEVQMQPGDALVAFTDGVSEAMNAADEEWGEERLAEAVRGSMAAAPAELIARVMAGAEAFTAGAPQHDDMTLLVLRVRCAPPAGNP